MSSPDKLTVVMLNWARPERVAKFAAQYLAMGTVAQLILFDNKPGRVPGWLAQLHEEFKNLTQSGHFVHVSASHDTGLVSRFAAAGLARTDHVLFVDDDIELPQAGVERLLGEYLRNDAGVVGAFGRRPGRDLSYSVANVFGEVEVVLTRACVTRRAIAVRAVEYTHVMARNVPGGLPYGNGEDIVLSYVAMDHTRRLNLAVKVPFKNHGYDDPNAISVRFPGHEAHRTGVLRWCDNLLMPAELKNRVSTAKAGVI